MLVEEAPVMLRIPLIINVCILSLCLFLLDGGGEGCGQDGEGIGPNLGKVQDPSK